MRAVGLITEYNPFHNGHLYHLTESKKAADAEVAVAVMSGHFLQRGEPALVDKWRRTEMALCAGVDVVVELPFPWACNSAPHFARGAIEALESFGHINALCFGSEAGNLYELQRCAEILQVREKEIALGTENLLREGVNYPQARGRILAGFAGNSADPDCLSRPNNILGIEYLRALKVAGSSIEPKTITRIGAGFHDPNPGRHGIASATAIRRLLQRGEDVSAYLPPGVAALLTQALRQKQTVDPDRYTTLLLGQIFRGERALRQVYLVEDGIENRLLAAADKVLHQEDLIAAVKSRHHTRTRIERMLTHILLNTDRHVMAEMLEVGPLYLTLLGANSRGRQFLAACRKDMVLPLVQNFSRVYALLKRRYGANSQSLRQALAQLDLQVRATRCYTLLFKHWKGENRNRDFLEKVRFFSS